MLHVHRAAHAGDLVDALSTVLAEPAGDDPFVPEVVAVPSRGIERWLSQELSLRLGTSAGGRDGVCANVLHPFPASVIGWAVDATEDAPADLHGRRPLPSPWDPAHVTWRLLEALEGTDDDGRLLVDTLGPFGAHVSGDHGRARRLPALRHVADLFDRYGVHRPSMVRAWQAGRDVDAGGEDLTPSARWQPRLWRAVRPTLGPSFAERVEAAADRLAAGGTVPGLPPRVSLYGLTALPASYAEVLTALGASHEVHLFLLHPSPSLWARVANSPAVGSRPPRDTDPTRDVPTHPLLQSWGRDARELQLVLGPVADRTPTVADAGEPDPGRSLLARLQHDVVHDRPPAGAPLPGQLDLRAPLEATTGPGHPRRRAVDDSVQLHACHGRLRQVEVLRDAVLGLMSDDPTVQPRDVVVMCPDVETYAPLVDAVFGADAHVAALDEDGVTGTGDHPTVVDGLPDLRVRLADRSLRQVNPLLRTLGDLLALPDGRVEATTLVDLVHRAPVRARFGFSDADAETIERWVDDLHVRWGLDGAHRAAHGLATDANTWRQGLDRLLVGVAVAEDGVRTVAGLLPHDDVEGGAVDLAGRLAELLDRVGLLVDGLSAPRPVADWCRDLRRAADLLTATPPDDTWQRTQLDRLLDDLRRAAGGDDAPTVDVTLAELRALLDDQLRGRPSRANHRTGDLTVCTLVPMRSVPYRVVCLLGLDDETFPRRTVPSGDDLVGRAPRVGDRDARSEDRQLLLDALLAAGDHLVVTYRGRDERTDAAVPPAVPIAELLDVLDATARPADGHGRARDLLVRGHPLRAADLRTFHPDDPFGFDPVAEAGARARAAGTGPAPRFLDALPGAPVGVGGGPTVVEWADFLAFIDKPVKGYLRARLQVTLRSAEDPVDDLLPIELDGLEQWGLGTRLLAGAIAGDLGAWVAAERARGGLPVGQIGQAALASVAEEVARLRDVALEQHGDAVRTTGRPAEVDLRVGDLHLVGAVPDVRDGLLLRLDYGNTKPKRLLKLWLPWLVLRAQGVPVTAALLTRGKKRTTETSRWSVFDEDLDAADARERLVELAALYVSGQSGPLPVFEETTPAFAGERRAGVDRDKALAKVGRAWTSQNFHTGGWFGDGADAHVRLVFGEVDLPEIVAMPPLPDEDGPGWVVDEPSRFGRLAHRVWDPLLDLCRSWGMR